jgi:hypothetical protein
MSGFGDDGKAKVTIYKDEVGKLLKQYKKIKKYMKSSIYQIKTIDGTEKVVSELLDEYKDNPIEIDG